MILENPVAPGQSFELVEHLIQRARESNGATIDGAGNGVITFGPVRAGVVWQLRRVTVRNPNAGVARIYVGSLGDDGYVGPMDLSGVGYYNWFVFAAGEVQVMPGESVSIVITGSTPAAAAAASLRYDIFEVAARPIPGAIRPRSDNSGFPAEPPQGDDQAGAYDRADESDLYDRDPTPPAAPPAHRHALDGGILTSFPADPSTPSGSDLF